MCSQKLHISAATHRGGRTYMEDVVDMNYCKDRHGNSVAYFAVFDGHGGKEAAEFCKNRLWRNLKKRSGFHSTNHERVKKTLSDAFLETHSSMWDYREKWPMTKSGHLSTAGTTASVVLIKSKHIYVANVGDSSVALVRKLPSKTHSIDFITVDHKPDSAHEMRRIHVAGGHVENKKGVWRVVWRRLARTNVRATRRCNVHVDIPFLAVARSLGDLWSWNSQTKSYVVSPNPDIWSSDLTEDTSALVVASDGLWNVFRREAVLDMLLKGKSPNTAHSIVNAVLEKCFQLYIRPDNTSAIVVYFNQEEIPPDEGLSDESEHKEAEEERSPESPDFKRRRFNCDSLLNNLGDACLSNVTEERGFRQSSLHAFSDDTSIQFSCELALESKSPKTPDLSESEIEEPVQITPNDC